MRPCYFRYGYDIAIPLLAKSIFHNMPGIAPQDRKYFATFKVSSYPCGTQGTYSTRDSSLESPMIVAKKARGLLW